jgi:hypothetical protein
VFQFATSEDAYNASQTSADILDGDVLIVPAEHAVAIMVTAWPTLYNEPDAGTAFHELERGGRWDHVPNLGGGTSDYSTSVLEAGKAIRALEDAEAGNANRSSGSSSAGDRAAEALSAAVLEPLRKVGELLAREVDEVKATASGVMVVAVKTAAELELLRAELEATGLEHRRALELRLGAIEERLDSLERVATSLSNLHP